MSEYSIVVDDVVLHKIASNKEIADTFADSLGGYATDDPSAHKGYIKTASGFIFPPKSFDTVKEIVVNMIESVTASILFKGIEFEGVKVSITDKILRNIIGIKGDSINAKKIKLNQTTIMDCSLQQIEDLMDLIETTVEEAEQTEIQLTEAVNLATTTEELDDIKGLILQATTN